MVVELWWCWRCGCGVGCGGGGGGVVVVMMVEAGGDVAEVWWSCGGGGGVVVVVVVEVVVVVVVVVEVDEANEIILELVFVYRFKVSSDWPGSLCNTFMASDWSVAQEIYFPVF